MSGPARSRTMAALTAVCAVPILVAACGGGGTGGASGGSTGGAPAAEDKAEEVPGPAHHRELPDAGDVQEPRRRSVQGRERRSAPEDRPDPERQHAAEDPAARRPERAAGDVHRGHVADRSRWRPRQGRPGAQHQGRAHPAGHLRPPGHPVGGRCRRQALQRWVPDRSPAVQHRGALLRPEDPRRPRHRRAHDCRRADRGRRQAQGGRRHAFHRLGQDRLPAHQPVDRRAAVPVPRPGRHGRHQERQGEADRPAVRRRRAAAAGHGQSRLLQQRCHQHRLRHRVLIADAQRPGRDDVHRQLVPRPGQQLQAQQGRRRDRLRQVPRRRRRQGHHRGNAGDPRLAERDVQGAVRSEGGCVAQVHRPALRQCLPQGAGLLLGPQGQHPGPEPAAADHAGAGRHRGDEDQRPVVRGAVQPEGHHRREQQRRAAADRQHVGAGTWPSCRRTSTASKPQSPAYR